MKIDLNRQEVHKLLVDRYGEADFRVFYTESDALWEAREGKKISELERPPEKETICLYFDA